MATTWLDRLQPSISLTSPQTQTVFTPLWRGNTMSAKKRLGSFSYPLSVGTVVQDLGLSGFDMPISIYFEGANNDTDSWAFLLACAEFGPWTVVHPVRGTMSLQLVSVDCHDEPVESGNITVVDTVWLNPASLKLVKSNAELTGQITTGIGDANSQATAAFAKTSTAIDSLASAYGSVTQGLQAVKQNLTNATATVLAGYSQIQGAIAGFSSDLASIAGLFLQLIELPGLIAGDLSAQLQSFSIIGQSAINIAPDAQNTQGIPDNTTIAQAAGAELVMVGVTAAMAGSVINTPPLTRPEALAAIGALLAWQAGLTTALDSSMLLFSGSPMASGFVSMATTWPQIQQLVALTIQYLLSIIFDLKTAITFTLPAERPPLAIAIDFYGDGWSFVDDYQFDFFIASNKLYGDLINLLPAGFQVTVYPSAVKNG